MDPADQHHNNLVGNSRSYNASLSMASTGGQMVRAPGRGPPCLMVHGSIYHHMENLYVADDETHRYAQIYFMDSAEDATDVRMRHPANVNLSRVLLGLLHDWLQRNNHYAAALFTCHQIMETDEAAVANRQRYSLVFNREEQQIVPVGIHPGRLNAPAEGVREVAAVFMYDEEEGVPNFHRDFALYYRPGEGVVDRIRLDVTSQHLDPLCYTLLFPSGEPGWNIRWNCVPYPNARPALGNRRITLLQYRSAQFQERHCEPFRPIVHFHALTQQVMIDGYLGWQSNLLNWYRMNQDQIWRDEYRALHDFVDREAVRLNMQARPSIILPSSFTGSDRNMRQMCLDAMAIFGTFGKPDLFITFTCNPQWPEIVDSLNPGERPHDRPDIVARVFHLKLKAMMQEILGGLFGPVVCFVYTIEFQKRGLPHAHILVTLQQGYKLDDEASIDRIICAEMPDPVLNPRLHAVISRMNVHGPCSPERCQELVHGVWRCKAGFPRPLLANTEIVPHSYPNHRRRYNPDFDNTMVVEYNAYLSAVYNTHICVKASGHMGCNIQYLFKYVFKGFDRASLNLLIGGTLRYDEIGHFMSGRYVGAPEAIWRLFEFEMHDRNIAVIRLSIHEEIREEIEYDENMEVRPVNPDRRAHSMLMAFFELNSTPPLPVRPLLYANVPQHFVYHSALRAWQPRQRGGNTVIGRIHPAGSPTSELYAIRVLLLNVPGPESFVALRTVNNYIHDTFRQAAQALNLIQNNDVFVAVFNDCVRLDLPPKFRQVFVCVVVTYNIQDALPLWEAFRHHMYADFQHSPRYRLADDEVLFNLALLDLNRRFQRSGRTNDSYNLPMPTGHVRDLPPPDVPQVAQPAIAAPIVLNPAQQAGYNRIMAAVMQNGQQRLFVIIGPGGSGKTTLYKQIIMSCRMANLRVACFATTGIAATLMEGGMTAHRGFMLPIDVHEEATSRLENYPDSRLGRTLRDASVILIDEITMLSRHHLRIIDRVLRAVTGFEEPFGRKVLVVGGDFRQLLPVVPGATRPGILANCVVSSNLWGQFEVITLTDNMRAQGDPEFVQWLLKVGTGDFPPVAGYENQNMLEIPQDMLLQVPPPQPDDPQAVPDPHHMPAELTAMITEIFGDNIPTLLAEDLSSRAILASTISVVMKVNNFIIGILPGQEEHLHSFDEIISDRNLAELNENFPAEYLNRQQPSGLPPHDLKLKVGVVVLLLRNIDPEQGLSNGTKLMVLRITPHIIHARILSESHRGEEVFVPRFDMTASDTSLPFELKRNQFPLIPAYAITINKSQGQTLERVGIYLNDVVFSHGQLYVALSRCRNRNNIKVFVREQPLRQGHVLQDHRVFTRNVIYREVFVHGELQAQALPADIVDALNQLMDDEEDELIADVLQQQEDADNFRRFASRFIADPEFVDELVAATALARQRAMDADDDDLLARIDQCVEFFLLDHLQDLLREILPANLHNVPPPPHRTEMEALQLYRRWTLQDASSQSFDARLAEIDRLIGLEQRRLEEEDQ